MTARPGSVTQQNCLDLLFCTDISYSSKVIWLKLNNSLKKKKKRAEVHIENIHKNLTFNFNQCYTIFSITSKLLACVLFLFVCFSFEIIPV